MQNGTITERERNMKMPQFWKIEYRDRIQWINPAHIVHVQDNPNANPPVVSVTMVAVSSGQERNVLQAATLQFMEEARETFLAYLVRETESEPPPPPA